MSSALAVQLIIVLGCILVYWIAVSLLGIPVWIVVLLGVILMLLGLTEELTR